MKKQIQKQIQKFKFICFYCEKPCKSAFSECGCKDEIKWEKVMKQCEIKKLKMNTKMNFSQ